jgi:hypothetical protein
MKPSGAQVMKRKHAQFGRVETGKLAHVQLSTRQTPENSAKKSTFSAPC